MKRVAILTAALAFMATGAIAAQTTTTTTTPDASATAKTTASDKTAISKACSAQADAKQLHGKQRKKFRSDCKKNGGKS